MIAVRLIVFSWMSVSAALMVVGALGPSVRVFGFVAGGLTGDDVFVVIAAVVASAVLVVHALRRGQDRWPAVVVAIMGLIGVAITGRDAVQIYEGGGKDALAFFGPSVGLAWGLFVGAFASASLALAAVFELLRGRSASGT